MKQIRHQQATGSRRRRAVVWHCKKPSC